MPGFFSIQNGMSEFFCDGDVLKIPSRLRPDSVFGAYLPVELRFRNLRLKCLLQNEGNVLSTEAKSGLAAKRLKVGTSLVPKTVALLSWAPRRKQKSRTPKSLRI